MYYMVGVAGTEIGKELPEVNITQVTTGGSTENAKRLIKGELDMGIVYGSHVFMSLQQTGPFKSDDKGTMLRGVARSEEHTSELQSLIRVSYDVLCFTK